MIDIYLCEDNKTQLLFYSKIIQEYTKSHPDQIRTFRFAPTPEALLEMISDFSHPAVYFIDILLGDGHMNGLMLAQIIRKNASDSGIIFLTTERDMAYKTFDYQIRAIDYIVKRPEYMLNQEALSMLKQRITRALDEYVSSLCISCEKALTLTSGSQIYKIPVSHILCAAALKGRHQIEVITNTQKITAAISLKDFFLQLDNRFTYCNKSCIIQLPKITELNVQKRTLTLCGNIVCDISVREMKKIRDYFQN